MKRKLAELWVMVKADSKRAILLGVLLLVLVGLSARAAWKLGPKRASAAEKATTASAIEEIARSAGVSVPAAEKRDRGPIITLPSPAPTKRDVFRLSEKVFPLPAQPSPDSRLAEKSGTDNAEEKADTGPTAEEVGARVGEEAKRLRLKGTLLGGSPTAVIESAREKRTLVVTPGQSVEGFTLVEVRALSVVLEKEGIRIEIERVQTDR